MACASLPPPPFPAPGMFYLPTLNRNQIKFCNYLRCAVTIVDRLEPGEAAAAQVNRNLYPSTDLYFSFWGGFTSLSSCPLSAGCRSVRPVGGVFCACCGTASFPSETLIHQFQVVDLILIRFSFHSLTGFH